jgi:hypothetical protein
MVNATAIKVKLSLDFAPQAHPSPSTRTGLAHTFRQAWRAAPSVEQPRTPHDVGAMRPKQRTEPKTAPSAVMQRGWRREWDSNPRWACTHAGFQDRCLKPLGHPSGAARAYQHCRLRKSPAVGAGLLGLSRPAYQRNGLLKDTLTSGASRVTPTSTLVESVSRSLARKLMPNCSVPTCSAFEVWVVSFSSVSVSIT